MDGILLKRLIAMGFHIDHRPWESEFVVFDSGSYYNIRASLGTCSILIAHQPAEVPAEALKSFQRSNWEQAAYILRLVGDCKELMATSVAHDLPQGESNESVIDLER